MESETEKGLGMSWNIKDNQFFYRVKINFSPKPKMLQTQPNISHRKLRNKFPAAPIRRMLLSQRINI